jgi:hypothetical protein
MKAPELHFRPGGRRHQVDRAGNVDGQAHANIAAHKNESG